MNKREKDLEEKLAAVTVGAAAALLVCMFGRVQPKDLLVTFGSIWLISIMVVFDIFRDIHRMKRRRARNQIKAREGAFAELMVRTTLPGKRHTLDIKTMKKSIGGM